MKTFATALILLIAACRQRTDIAYPVQAVEGLSVTVERGGNVGWQIEVQNDTEEMVSLVWDESSYVNSEGISLGRLLRGNTKRGNVDREQPDDPIAPGARLKSFCVPEEHASIAGGDYVPATDGLSSGELRLVFASDEGKATWVEAIVFDGSGAPSRRAPKEFGQSKREKAAARSSSPRGFYCSASESAPAAGLCVRDRADCERVRESALAAVSDLSACALTETAQCLDSKSGSERCAPTSEGCAAAKERHASLADCIERR